MNPTLNPTVTWPYPLIILAAMGVGIAISRRTQRSLALSPRERLGIGLGAFCGAMIGAKLPFALADWEGLLSGMAWFGNGKTIVFGLVGGYLGVEIAKGFLDVKTKTGDTFAVPVAASVAVGRLGCFVGGCCFGAPTKLPWAVDFGDHIPRHPTQIYESLFHATFACVLAILLHKGIFRGNLVKFYIIVYLIYRFFTEFIRPEPIVGMTLTFYQWSCLFFIPLFLGLWVKDSRSLQSSREF